MSTTSTRYIAEKMPTVTIGKGKLILTRDIQNQIDFLHHNIGNIEWIGVLCFKRLQGDLSDPDKFVLEARHIYLMSVDTAGHTDADMGDSVIDIYESVPDMQSMRMGLVHSHHNMDTFFSGEDLDELQINAPLHNYYLSLIVNKAGKYVAKVVFVGDSVTTNIFTDVNDNIVERKSTEKVLYCIDMAIIKEDRAEVSDLFKSRYAIVEEEAKKKEAARKAKYAQTATTYTNPNNYRQGTIFYDNIDSSVDPSKAISELNGEQSIQELIKTWLNEGTEYSLSMEPSGLFNTIGSGIQFYNKYFEKQSKEVINGFAAYMQRLLFELTINLKPSVVMFGLKRYLTGSDLMNKVLNAVVQDHANFCGRMKREMIKDNLIEEYNTNTYNGYYRD